MEKHMRFFVFMLALPHLFCSVLYADEMADAFSQYARLRDEWKYKEAIPYAEEFLRLSLEKHGPNDANTAKALNNLGTLYYGLRDYEQAIPLYSKALLAFEKAFGADDPSILGVAANLGNAYIRTEQYENAEVLLKRGFEISTEVFGPDHESTKWAEDNYRYVRNVHGIESWTDSSGRFSRDARFVRVDNGVVSLSLKGGRVIKINLEKLSEDDQIKAIACQALTKRFNEKASEKVK